MPLKQQLSNVQTQQLVLSPQIRQFLRLLQMPIIELRAAIEQELSMNPAVEEISSEEEIPENTSPETPTPTPAEEEEGSLTQQHEFQKKLERLDQLDEIYRDSNFTFTRHDTDQIDDLEKKQTYRETLITKHTSLADHLIWQSQMLNLSEKEKEIVLHIIGNINDDGYLTCELDEIARAVNISTEEAQRMLEVVQNLDPPGVAACNLSECLTIQLKRMGRKSGLAMHIVTKYLPLLEKRKYLQIARALKVSETSVREAIKVIAQLEPKPGRPFFRDEPIAIVPDFRIAKDETTGRYRAEPIDNSLPRLRISPHYRRMLRNKSLDKKTRDYLRERINSGLWFMNAIGQRKSTLQNIADTIVEIQQDYFENGRGFLKPLRMKDIAARLNIHESTVSRAIQGKYISTPHNTVPFRNFFSSSLATENGPAESQTSVMERIRKLIESEDSKKPLSDQQLTAQLKSEGLKVARRTVAKYREMMKILPSHIRKAEASIKNS